VKKEALLQFLLAPCSNESKEEAVAYLRSEGIDIDRSKKKFKEFVEKNKAGQIAKKHERV